MKNMKNYLIGCLVLGLIAGATRAAEASGAVGSHPRIYGMDSTKAALTQKIQQQPWAAQVYQGIKKSVDVYVDRHVTDPNWIVSRLQMHWKTRYAKTYVNGSRWSHGEGKAPVPTVRFAGQRDWNTDYARPKLEDIQPYSDDQRGMWLQNKTKNGQPWEWAPYQKTGHIVEQLNAQIMGLAEKAAFLYWVTDQEKYAKFATDIMWTYAEGMAHRSNPITYEDHSKAGIIGLATFEVIHEAVSTPLAVSYDYLYDYLIENGKDVKLIQDLFRRWSDRIIEGGGARGNWNINQARYIVYMGLTLENDDTYADGKGMQHYIRQFTTESSRNQAALKRIVPESYDPENGVWPEAPGYAFSVTDTILRLAQVIHNASGQDVLEMYPIIVPAATVVGQFLFPNGYMVGFGDTYHDVPYNQSMEMLLARFRRTGETDAELQVAELLREQMQLNAYRRESVDTLLALTSYVDKLPEGKPDKPLRTRTFYADSVNYLTQRNSENAQDGLMISLAGSRGGHSNANGMAMELYGKGMVIGPDSGRGPSYWTQSHGEYYAVMAAHNTVVVDGISDYRAGRATVTFKVLDVEPEAGSYEALSEQYSFSDTEFVEPKTDALQRRVMGIVRTSHKTGFYVDIFRSKRKDGRDKKHEYIYRNVGQELNLTQFDGQPLLLKTTEELGSDQGDHVGYNYFTDKLACPWDSDIHGVFNADLKDQPDVRMGLWMQGQPGRTVFSVRSPVSRAISRGSVPHELAELPLPTLIVRQEKEAWSKPFVAIFEPYTKEQGSALRRIRSLEGPGDFVGVRIQTRDTGTQTILNNTDDKAKVEVDGIEFAGTYGIISENGRDIESLYLGSGRRLIKNGFGIDGQGKVVRASIEKIGGEYYYSADQEIVIHRGEERVTRPAADKALLNLEGKIIANSPEELLQYLDDDNVMVMLKPGVYSINAADIAAGTYTNPIYKVTGNNSTYDFTGVTINFSTDLLQASGRVDNYQIQILGNHNVLRGLTMVDVGAKTDHPTWRATNVVMDGAHNRVEGFHMTVKGSWPYSYGDAFGKGGSFTIRHYKHCGLLVRGESNHVKDVIMIHKAYGHGIYMQAANNPTIEGCYVEGEVRTTDDMLAEEGTRSPADKVNFKTVWGGRRLQPGSMMSLQEEGIRAYNGGETWIDGKEYNRGTSNATILNNTVKWMRGGVTLTHCKGKRYVEGCTTIGCESGYKIGSGDIVNCSGDAAYGPVFGVDYDRDRNTTADIKVLPSDHYYNGSKTLAKIIGHDHKITLRSSESNPKPSFPVSIDRGSGVEIHNLTQYPLMMGSRSSGTTGRSSGKITDEGSNNSVEKIEGKFAVNEHPRLFANDKERQIILDKIKNEDWARKSWEEIKNQIDPYVDRHVTDPEWIVSRLAMYWKDGERYTQCYLKKQDWDYGKGNAPVPTVRLPGMRRWNNYLNVPLEDRIPYNESGDMLGIDRSSDDKTPVLVPYKESGHMIRYNNDEILQLAATASFAYWLTQDEKYAKFSGDILWTWLLGIYYMEPPYDPSSMENGYAPGGIFGYYDYEQIHDDRQVPAAHAYDFLHDYMKAKPHSHLSVLDKDVTEVAGTVFKRFVDLGLVRGGKSGNWNVNGYKQILASMLVLESNDYYDDKQGRDYYIPFYTKNTTRYHTALPDLIKSFDSKTGLWPESPGYASGIISSLLEMGMPLYRLGINTLADNPLMQKAAMANLGWLDARGNLVVFGDMRGGPTSFEVFERMLAYYTMEGDTENAKKMATVIRKGIASGQYSRDHVGWKGLCLYPPLPESGNELPFHRSAYSEFHQHLIMKNGNSEANGLMFTLYGGARRKSHLTGNGLAMQFYGQGYALAPDSAAYESYWTDDFKYHSSPISANTIVPGYSQGKSTINTIDPAVDPEGFYNSTETSPACSFADVSAQEKRRLVAMVRTSPATGYYVDIFRSDQADNDYIHHNLGNSVSFKDAKGKTLALAAVDDLGIKHHAAYSYFENPRKLDHDQDFTATWTINAVTPSFNTDMWMLGQTGREIYSVDAPPTTLRDDLTPGMVNKAPQSTPALILRQTGNNAKAAPFVAVFESYNEGKQAIKKVSKIADSENFICLAVESKSGSKQVILNAIDDETYQPIKDVTFQGSFAIASETNSDFDYLYLGKGKSLKSGSYQIEAVEGTVSAELRKVNGKFTYSADKPVKIKLSDGVAKEYLAGYDIEI
ncbi:hypothetical protein ACFL6U_00430 [Planctomycetota bacterium]